MKYHHLGIPTKDKLKDEIYLEHLKMFVSGFGKNPYGIEWVRYEDDADFPDIFLVFSPAIYTCLL